MSDMNDAATPKPRKRAKKEESAATVIADNQGEASTELAVQEVQRAPLVLEGDPEEQLAFATKAANALMKVVKPKKINNRDYLEFGAWQTLGRFFGSTVGVEWTKEIGPGEGWEARAVVYRNGEVISAAEAMCLRSERNWKTRDDFALRSMAQTRASAKALRNAFGWVAELAGYASTPAEEMDFDSRVAPPPAAPPRASSTPRTRIAQLMLRLGYRLTDMTKQEATEHIAQLTGLAPTEENLEEIENRLLVIVEEKREGEPPLTPDEASFIQTLPDEERPA